MCLAVSEARALSCMHLAALCEPGPNQPPRVSSNSRVLLGHLCRARGSHLSFSLSLLPFPLWDA